MDNARGVTLSVKWIHHMNPAATQPDATAASEQTGIMPYAAGGSDGNGERSSPAATQLLLATAAALQRITSSLPRDVRRAIYP